MIDLITRGFKFIMSLKTAAQQLLAVLLIIIIVLAVWVVNLYQEVRIMEVESRKREIAAVAAVRSEWAKDKQVDQKEIAGLRVELKNEKKERLTFVTDLWQDQKRLNNTAEVVNETQRRLANENRRHVNVIKKDAKELIEKIK